MMSNQNILIFGAEAAPSGGPVGTLRPPYGAAGSSYLTAGLLSAAATPGFSRVPVEAAAASLKAVMEQVSSLFRSSKDAVGELHVVYVDVGLVIAADGSVGLLGTDGSAGAQATLTVRLQL
jgi:hypothetical protein